METLIPFDYGTLRVVWWVLLGALLIGVLLNGLTMMNVPYYAQDIVKGGVFVVALAFAFLRKER
jgi:ribose/xylose/arabinose/galactoside ABC-type transport system permease subunit